nr:hypothetical protein [Succinivibrionaceae bacterium]
MSETEVNEASLRDALAELAKVSVGNLQRVFDRAPGGLGWEEIEQGLAEGRPLKEICGLPEDDLSAAYGEAKRLMGEGDLG